MKPCEHPLDQVTADILQGDWPGHEVKWCRQCGAFRVRVFDPDYKHSHPNTNGPKNCISPWNLPTFQIDPLAPVPELGGSYPVVLYFANKADAEEFTAAVLAEKPNLQPRQL